MSNITRYSEIDADAGMFDSPSGEWVRYIDHEAALKAAEAKVKELEGWVFELSGKSDDREAWKDKAEAAEAKLEKISRLEVHSITQFHETRNVRADELEALLKKGKPNE